MTFGKVSKMTEDLTWLNRNRRTTCLLLGARVALIINALSATKVLPDLEPPTSMMCLASPVISPVALLWAAVGLNKVGILIADVDDYAAAILAGQFLAHNL